MAAEDFEDPIGKGGKVYKGKYPNTKTLPQNTKNSPIAYRHLNRPMNHWIDALSHFHHLLWFLSHDQYINNSGGEQRVPVSLYWLDEGATTGRYSLNCFLVSELTWFSSFQSMFGCVCFFEKLLIFGPLEQEILLGLAQNSFGYPYKTID